MAPKPGDFDRRIAQQRAPKQQTPANKQGFWKPFGISMALIAIIIAIIAVCLGNGAFDNDKTAGATPPSTSATPTATADCKYGEADTSDPHIDSKANTDGSNGDAAVRELVAKKVQFTPYSIATAFAGVNKYQEPPKWQDLVVKNNGKTCFNEAGAKMRDDLLIRLASATIEENVSIPVDLKNSGMAADGTPIVNTHAGYPEGRKGTLYKWNDAGKETRMYVDYYCANIPQVGVPHGYVEQYIPQQQCTTPGGCGQVIVPPPPGGCVGGGCVTTVPPPPCGDCCETCVTTTPPPPPLETKDPCLIPGQPCANGDGGTGTYGGGPRPTTPKPETTWTPRPETYTPPPSPTPTATQAPSVTVAPPPSNSAPLPSVDTGSQTSNGHVDTNSPVLSGTDFG